MLLRNFMVRFPSTKMFQSLLLRIHFKPKASNSWKLFSTNTPQPIESTKKAFLLYHNLKFDSTLARLFAGLGVFACGMSAYVSFDLTKIAKEKEQEVSAEPPSLSSQIYQSKLGAASPYIYGFAGIFILFMCSKYTNSIVKKILLSTDHRTVTFVTHGLFNKGRVRSFPVENIAWKGTKIKASTDSSSKSFYLLKSGTITNKPLFEWAIGFCKPETT